MYIDFPGFPGIPAERGRGVKEFDIRSRFNREIPRGLHQERSSVNVKNVTGKKKIYTPFFLSFPRNGLLFTQKMWYTFMVIIKDLNLCLQS